MILKLITAAVLTGLISGFFITFYELLISFLTRFFFMGDPFKTIPTLPVWYLYALPTVAIFVVNYLISRDKHIREYGVSDIADSIVRNEMILKVKTLFLKIIASALSLSTGFAVGTEGPSAGIGAMIAYQIHKLFKLPQMLIKMMISVGASSGIAAIFVSPLTGIAFAIENIAYQFIKQYVTYLILASVIAFAISINYLEPIIFKHSTGRDLELNYIYANLLFIPFITAFVYFYLFLKQRLLHFIDLEIFKKFSRYRNYIFALIGGSVVGTVLLIEPHAAFSGKAVVTHLMNIESKIPLYFILGIIVLRIIGTTVAIYSNAVGGIFLPLMSIGALIGYGFAEAFSVVHFPVEPFYFAAIGAAVFMGVLMKLPLTAVILAMETTFDYNVVIATGISVVLVEYLSNLYFHIIRQNATKTHKSPEKSAAQKEGNNETSVSEPEEKTN
ncbi:chloride channel protein [Sulfurovum sp. ST-21]|uniref:Chloride channel protein n=1 Tax=Sulfurovum indicum TaxID=2779528 RepID=A0A7M1S6C8_9BACT|nr:chloride channel protein [Sulfurovum indicum]QOR62896.1 chloride channel protein [Sulfurovum indicum]